MKMISFIPLFLQASFIFCFSFIIISPRSQSQMIFEKGSFSEIIQKAQKEKKMIFMDCYTSWCVPCYMMSDETFKNDTVSKFFNENYINCSFDMEKGEGIKLAEIYKVGCYPTLLFLDIEGKIVHRATGYMDVNEFMKFSDEAHSSQNSFSAVEKKYRDSVNNGEVTFSYLKLLSETCLPFEKTLNDYLSKQKDEDLINENNWKIITEYVKDYYSKEVQYVINNLKEFRKKYNKAGIWSDPDNFLYKVINLTGEQYGQDSKKSYQDLEKLLSDVKKSDLTRFSDTSAFFLKLSFYKNKKDWESYSALNLKEGDSFINEKYFSVDNITNDPCWNILVYCNNDKLLEKAVHWLEINKNTWDLCLNNLNTPDSLMFEKLGIDTNKLSTEVQKKDMLNAFGSNCYSELDTYSSLLFKLKKKNAAKINAKNAIKVGKRFGEDVSNTESLLKSIEKL